ncbi:protocadherin beta-4 [Octopus bimaculoides]|uniref:Cadherin domain-containing protein n=1 Tax=Octopus bimaculoides TaxID=37653 RepID=A0A0L8HW46_OCTBM|nr:protocadherin beta-4 [Octopus bimaculoides]|eukprot:XP_014768892.1 PREDICTED: protocadherin beta-4-like [Octopus bimaculoides]
MSSKIWLFAFEIFLIFIWCCSATIDLTYSIEEEKPSASYVGDIAADSNIANELDTENLGPIAFNQLQQTMVDTPSLFNITRAGKLYTTASLDVENLCSKNTECFQLLNVAVQQGESFKKILKIKVLIKDINDHQPTFPSNETNLNFTETDGKGRKIAIPNAIDGDIESPNNQVTYTLRKQSDHHFGLFVQKREVGADIIEIVLEGELDRETQESYTLEVVATDGGTPPKQSVLIIKISVIDVNDNWPYFSKGVYNVSVKNTHKPSLPIITLHATDKDAGKNGKITYKLKPDVKLFKINHETGDIFLNENFTSEKKEHYKLIIAAEDNGEIPLVSSAIVNVKFMNQYNTPPKILISFAPSFIKNTVTISEGIPVGSFIAYVIVVDKDVGQNGDVQCHLKHNNFELRKLNPKEYKIVIKQPVDRETTDHYKIDVFCRDKGLFSVMVKNHFFIQVKDINDVRPQFSKKAYKFLVYENEKANYPVGFVTATDLDVGPGGQLEFSILSKNKQDPVFQINNAGFITTTKLLDYEKQKHYQFHVLAKDNGTPPLNDTVDVIVEVMDKNDNAPYFNFPTVNPFSFDVHYHPQSDNEITVLKASDKDSGSNAFLHYQILEGNEQQLFMVKPYSGVLLFSRKVYPNDAAIYRLVVAVNDSGIPSLSAMTTLSLTLTVSNSSLLMTNVQAQSKKVNDVNLSIIIIVVAVIFSIILVVSATVCIVRYINVSNRVRDQRLNQLNETNPDAKHLIYQASSPTTLLRVPEESTSENNPAAAPFYSVVELPSDWTIATLTRRHPVPTQESRPPHIAQASDQDGAREINSTATISRRGGSRRDSENGWRIDDATKHYEEIPALRFPKDVPPVETPLEKKNRLHTVNLAKGTNL